MKYVRKGAQIVVGRGLADDADLFDRLIAELRGNEFVFGAVRGRNRALLPKLTLGFTKSEDAQQAEKWIDDHFEA